MSRTPWKRTRVGAALFAILALAGAASPHNAAAQASGDMRLGAQFDVFARADALQVEFVDPGFLILADGRVVDASPSTAQARLDSTGTSEAFAAVPYPGEVVLSLPGLVNGLAGGNVPLPPYPLVVNSNYPFRPKMESGAGPYAISASSTPNSSKGVAKIGASNESVSVLSVVATAETTRDEAGTIVARASSYTEAFSVGPLLTVGEISSGLTLTARPGQRVAKKTSTSLGTITIAGTKFGLTDKGLVADDTTLLPTDTEALSDLLRSAGIELEYIPATETETSVTSAGLAISYTQVIPIEGEVTVRVALGQVSASAVSGPSFGALDDGETSDLRPPASLETAEFASESPSGMGQAYGADAVDTPGAEEPSTTANGRTSVGTPASANTNWVDADGATFYLVLVAASAMMLLSSWAVGTLSVRRRPPSAVA